MARVLLVSYAGYPYTPSSLCPDNGLAVLAAILKAAGHEALIIDYGTVETMQRLYPEALAKKAQEMLPRVAAAQGQLPLELLRQLGALDAELTTHQEAITCEIAREIATLAASWQPDMVGFKLWNGDGFTGSVTIAQAIREQLPDIMITAGGPQTTWFGRRILAKTDVFDALILGEGEDKILELTHRAALGQTVDGMAGIHTASWDGGRPTNNVDLNTVPTGLYDTETYPAMAGDQKIKLIVLNDSRGCPYCCAFCAHPVESGNRLRTRSANLIVDDMQHAITNYNIHAFRFAGSSTSGQLMAEVASEIIERGLKVQYTSFAHFASSTPDHFQHLAASGLRAMFFGLETASPSILKSATGKPQGPGMVRETIAAAQAAGIAVVCSLIVPLPGDTQKTMQDSLQAVITMHPDSVPVQFPGLLPETPWFLEPEKYGFEVDQEAYLRENLDYKIKLLFPPSFWKPLPYRLNGMDFSEFIKITGWFTQQLEAAGILTGVPDDNLLMAELAGMPPRILRDAARLWCTSGNASAMGQFVQAFNRGMEKIPG